MVVNAPPQAMALHALRAQFPVLATTTHGAPLAYLDNAASTQAPLAVIEALAEHQRLHHANIHRGVYGLSREATERYEAARARVARFLNAAEPAECLFTRGTTESINLVAQSWGRANLRPGDEIILSMLEHHSNIVPWQLVAEATGARIRVIPIDDAGTLQLDAYRALLSPRTRLVAVNQVSNALGTLNPVADIIAAAHAAGALVLIDGAQWVAHGPTDVRSLDADFYAFSGHKLYGPTGIGVLYGKRALLSVMPPWQGGGDMIERVSFERTTYAEIPARFEAGTPPIAAAVGLAAAIDWIEGIGWEAIGAHEHQLLRLATERLGAIPGIELKGTSPHKCAVLSWVMREPPLSTLDVGLQLDRRGICVRTGHHCCEPLMERLGVDATLRASFALYNSAEEVERLGAAIEEILDQARERSASRHAPPVEELAYPAASADSPEAAARELIDSFALLPDWPTRLDYLIELGEHLPAMPEALKNAASRINGCQSLVHLVARRRPDAPERVEFLADSDAALVRGLIALLQQLWSGQSAAAILAFDFNAFLIELGLANQLSMGRRNGLDAMVRRLRQFAAED